MKHLSVALLFCSFTWASQCFSQTTIVSDDFEHSLTAFTSSGVDTFFSGLSSVNDRPASSPFAFSGTYSYGNPGGTRVLTSGMINTSAYTSVQLNLRLASFAVNLSGGNDLNDSVIVEVSPDNGAHYYPTVEVTGNVNNNWSYSSGTGIASAPYDGDVTPSVFTPAGCCNTFADGYSTVNITGLPQGTSVRIRITLKNDTSSGELWVIDNFSITGTPVTGGLIVVNPLSLSNFIAVTGNISAEQSYTINGSSLTNDISINAPTGYEISTISGSGFTSALTLTQTLGVVNATTIYVRLNTNVPGLHTGNIANTSPGATTRTVAVSGNLLYPEPTVAPTISFSNLAATSLTINFSGGSGAGRIVIMKQNSAPAAAPVDGTSYTANANFGSGVSIAPGEFIVYQGSGSSVNVTGLSSNRTFYVAVYEYNDSNTVDARNFANIAGTGNAATLPLAQGLEITAANTLYQVDFDNTVARVNNGAFAGVSVNPSPATGELNSNAWVVFESDALASTPGPFGATDNSGGGVSPGNVVTPNYYAFETTTGNRSLGIQVSDTIGPHSSVLITLRLQNNTGTVINQLALAFNQYYLNNENAEIESIFQYSVDNIHYHDIFALEDTSLEMADPSPVWQAFFKSASVTGLSIPNGDNFYFRWVVFNFLTIPTDEFALDNIQVVANPTTVFPSLLGNYQELSVNSPVVLSGNTTVAGNVLLNGQNLTLGNFSLDVNGNVQGSSAGFVQTNGTGALTMTNVTGARTFPVGATTYNPLTIANGSGLNWSVRVNNGINGSFLTDKAVLRTWTITPSTNPTPAGANLTFQYNDGDATQIGTNYNPNENVVVWHNNGQWAAASGGLVPTGTAGGIRTVTLTNWSQYSPFALANLSGTLPVRFGQVTANRIGTKIKLNWENLTESDILYYSVEHSSSANQFTSMAQIPAALNNGGASRYEWIDINPFTNSNFYRVKAIELSGKTLYSSVVRVDGENAAPTLLVYPNPISEHQTSISLINFKKGIYNLKIFSNSGSQVYFRAITHEGGSAILPLQLPAKLTKGVYWLKFEGESFHQTVRLLL